MGAVLPAPDARSPGGGYQYSGGGDAGDTRIPLFGDIIFRCWSTVGNAADDLRRTAAMTSGDISPPPNNCISITNCCAATNSLYCCCCAGVRFGFVPEFRDKRERRDFL